MYFIYFILLVVFGLYILRNFLTSSTVPIKTGRGMNPSQIFTCKVSSAFMKLPNVEAVMEEVRADLTEDWQRRFSGIAESVIRSVAETKYASVKLNRLPKRPRLLNRLLKTGERRLNISILKPIKLEEIKFNVQIMHNCQNYVELWRNTIPGKTRIILSYLGTPGEPQVLAFDESIGFKVVPDTEWDGHDPKSLAKYSLPVIPESSTEAIETKSIIGNLGAAPTILHRESFDTFTRTLIVLPGAVLVRFEFLPKTDPTKNYYVTGGVAFDIITGRRVLPKYECFVSNVDTQVESYETGVKYLSVFDQERSRNYNIDCDSCINVVRLRGETVLLMVLVFDVNLFRRARAVTPQCRELLVTLQMDPNYSPIDLRAPCVTEMD